MVDRAREIAGRLTHSEQMAVLHADADGHVNAHGRTLFMLGYHGLAISRRRVFVRRDYLTDLGLEVRRILEAENE